MQTYLNQTGVPLSLAVYLATDHYDYVPNSISATGLMKPIRQILLPKRIPKGDPANSVEITSVVKSRTGTAIHDGIEKAWTGGHYRDAMKSLGYSQDIIDRVVVNPEGPLAKDAIPVYMEIRSFKDIEGKRVSGKFDFVAEGRLEDFKSTSTFTWVNGTKADDYQLQGSIYRWLNPKIITQDHMAIQFVFTDWMPGKAKQSAAYPTKSVEQLLIPLLSVDETETFVREKIQLIDLHENTPEPDLPRCTDKELWRKAPAYKYYKDPNKRARSTKNFDNKAEAMARLAKDGSVGVVIDIPGEVVACKYCRAFTVCTQKDEYLADGSIIY